MRLIAVIALFLTSLTVSGAHASDATASAISSLSAQDQMIFSATLKKCAAGTVGSALSIAFEKENFINGLANWLQFISFDPKAGDARVNGRGMSPAIAQVRRSPGFWIAMTECYGYKYGEMNYGNLMKQIIDMGHLTTESASTVTGLVVATGGANLTRQAMAQFPLVSRFVAASLISLQVGQLVNLLVDMYYPHLDEQEKQNLNEIKDQAFKEPNKAIAAVDHLAVLALEKIAVQLQSSELSEEDRAKLITKRNIIVENLNNLRSLRPKN